MKITINSSKAFQVSTGNYTKKELNKKIAFKTESDS